MGELKISLLILPENMLSPDISQGSPFLEMRCPNSFRPTLCQTSKRGKKSAPKHPGKSLHPPTLSVNAHIWKQHISKRGFPCSCCFPFFPTKRYLPRNILLLVHLVIFSIVVVSAPHCIECSLFQLFQALNMRITSIWRKSQGV